MGKHDRKKNKRRQLLPKFLILCEGAKTERQYFNNYISDNGYGKNRLITVKVIDTEKNTARELVKEGIKLKELKDDKIWVVFDKDGYTKHAEAFSLAERKDINIAFSSICFETWVLMHFEYTTAAFLNYNDLFKKKLKLHLPEYDKGDSGLYNKIKDRMLTAIQNSEKLNIYVKEGVPNGTPDYELNPYTNIPDLFKALEKFPNK